jgi:hypothetical protein
MGCKHALLADSFQVHDADLRQVLPADFFLQKSEGEKRGVALVHVEAEDVLIAQSAKKTHSRASQNCLLAETVGIVAAVEIDP